MSPEVRALLQRLCVQLPKMPDPDAVPEEICVEAELTWKDWEVIMRECDE